MHPKSFRKTTVPKIVKKGSSCIGMMISIYSEMIPYHFTVDWYDFYRTDIFHDFTAKNKINIITIVTWSDALYHVEWIFPDQSITLDAVSVKRQKERGKRPIIALNRIVYTYMYISICITRFIYYTKTIMIQAPIAWWASFLCVLVLWVNSIAIRNNDDSSPCSLMRILFMCSSIVGQLYNCPICFLYTFWCFVVHSTLDISESNFISNYWYLPSKFSGSRKFTSRYQ